jgi:hypothetical protein
MNWTHPFWPHPCLREAVDLCAYRSLWIRSRSRKFWRNRPEIPGVETSTNSMRQLEDLKCETRPPGIFVDSMGAFLPLWLACWLICALGSSCFHSSNDMRARAFLVEQFDFESYLRVSAFQFTWRSALHRELFQFLDEIKAAKWLFQIIRN